MSIDVPIGHHREGFIAEISLISRSPFSPWKGEKVADRPDEGVFAGSVARQSFTAFPFEALEIQRSETSGSRHWLQPTVPVGTRIAHIQN